MVPTVEEICIDLHEGRITLQQAIQWLSLQNQFRDELLAAVQGLLFFSTRDRADDPRDDDEIDDAIQDAISDAEAVVARICEHPKKTHTHALGTTKQLAS